MEVVVNDANILIDLCQSGLLEYCRLLQIEFRTLDLIIEEVRQEHQRKALDDLISDGTLKVSYLDESLMQMVSDLMSTYQGGCNLSLQDVSIMVYAKQNNYRLLTGDKVLRKKASEQNVIVSGVLYIVDIMIKKTVPDKERMISALERLKCNNRLPQKLIDEKIACLRS